MELIIGFIVLFVFLVIKGFFDRKKAKQNLLLKLETEFGTLPSAEYTEDKMSAIAYYLKHRENNFSKNSVMVDDITWNDLDLNYMYYLLNATRSAMGEEYLWAILHELMLEDTLLEQREHVIRFFETHPEERLRLQFSFACIGKEKKSSVYQCIRQMSDVKKESNFKHYAVIACMLAGGGVLPFSGAVGGGILMLCVAYNVLTYYKRKGETSAYFTAFARIIRMLDHAAQISKEEIPELSHWLGLLREKSAKMTSLRRNAPILVENNATGDMLSMLLDYVRIIFHTDLIRFNCMITKFEKEKEEIKKIFELIGFLDSMCAVASYRTYLGEYAIPQLENTTKQLQAESLKHPYLNEPVPADITTGTSVLLTGSNASGKSTFLKSVAINAILAQTIHTVWAKQYHASYFRILSSMALTDNLLSGESYYIVEIRSLKRILNAAKENGTVPVLCFVDEVLRGTNTVERIAASSRILHSIAVSNALMFAATHDIELTYMLEDYFSNYHFEEQIVENEIHFDFQLKSGRATSQNAISLLGLMGYPEEIIGQARTTAANFLKSGEWRKIEA